MTSITFELPSDVDLDALHALLTETYWSPGIPRETVARACAHSLCAIARNDAGALIGFARVVTDRATFAWLCDVIIHPAHRGAGLGRALVSALQDHPECRNLRRWLLGTRDAHGVYAPLGFAPLAAPERMMEIRNTTPYGEPAG
jgi:GNAT superfamily N-acetyltransferase